ncbi:MAG: DUF308 domain-containing protein [Armatimonadetes bacterium]|nr:DUF308 domain-containing protein [Armatimonadota bacterium]
MSELEDRPLRTRVREAAGTVMLLGFLVTILGVLMIIAPFVTGVAIAIMVGALLIAAGVLRLIFALRAASWGAGAAGTIVGVIALVCGIVMVVSPAATLSFLTLLLAGYLILHGIFEVITAMALSRVKGWGWLLVGGLLSMVLGVLIWRQWPVSGAWAIGLLVGIGVLFNGISLIALGSAGRAITGRAAPSSV